MLFNSIEYIFLFLPVAVLGYFLLNRAHLLVAAKWWLAFVSVLFYAWWGLASLPVLAASLLINWATANAIWWAKGKSQKLATRFFYAGLGFNLLNLGCFKYFDFIAHGLSQALGMQLVSLGVALPLGISFFTLTQIAYLADAKEGLVGRQKFLNYALFVLFFPHLIIGPILHHKDMMPQFDALRAKVFSLEGFAAGMFLFAIGFAKKALLADPLAPTVGYYFDDVQQLGLVEAWQAALAFTCQLYFDFSGYVDMALGSALMLNIRMPENFNSPLRARSVIDFWSRWHMSLTNFLTTYVYTPILFAFKINIPAWRRPAKLAFTAMELQGCAPSVELQFEGQRGETRTLSMRREVDEKHGRLVRALYHTEGRLGSASTRLRLEYTGCGLDHAYLGEVMLDDIGIAAPKKTNATIRTLDDWQATVGRKECAQVRRSVEGLANSYSTKDMLRLLLGRSSSGAATNLVYWKQFKNNELEYVLHALMLKVDTTGDPAIDLMPAWLMIPGAAHGSVPLVVLPQQGHIYAGLEPLGILGERELALAQELARGGVASLVFDSYRFSGAKDIADLFKYYPSSGVTAKDLENLRRLLDFVLRPSTQHQLAVNIDSDKVGIWGFSYGAWTSLLAGIMDDRIKAVAFSSFHYRDRDIVPGLSSALYIPQLACLADRSALPISIPRLLREYKRDVFAIVPDVGLLNDWTHGLSDSRVKVVVNPYGHVVTEAEKSAVLNFFYETFGLPARSRPNGPRHALPVGADEMRPYVERENTWRAKLIEGLSGQ